ncbi:MAG TPA: signal recognition particle subunit SRP19/SEC65 family protein [Methanoregulaceae archaeon]|nr:signal recognition particle subunit SRP19/SEC65 family protein [Methanoregulaceae archaeon]
MKGERILYPCYFDATLRRREGRKVPLSKAVRNPGLPDIETALKKNGVKYRIETKPHPAHWSEREGRILAEWDKSKGELLKRICSKLDVRK